MIEPYQPEPGQEFPYRYTARLAGHLELGWQRAWKDAQAYRVANPGQAGFDSARPKFYCLDMFPYPSGAGLHVGHPEGYTATDIISRYKRMCGFNVLHPMGWDAFGLPAEQYAIQTGVHPAITTRAAIDNFRRQLQRFGFSYDWSREFGTIDEAYYRWTQWIFLRIYSAWYDDRAGRARPIAELVDMLEQGERRAEDDAASGGVAWKAMDAKQKRAFLDSKRLAYLGEQTVNWCPKLGTALANEEVIDGRSERGGYPVFRKPLKQWMFRITAYAERLLADLALVDWPESTRTMQAEWIGRSEGAEIDFPFVDGHFSPGQGTKLGVAGRSEAPSHASQAPLASLRVFTTRPDTIFGATFMVVAPEHRLVEHVLREKPKGMTDEAHARLREYVAAARNRSDVERQESKDKSGAALGIDVINPATGKRIPVWTADYVLIGYGHGAIMAVPAHDERDFAFAQANGLAIRDVVYPRHLAAMAFFAREAKPEQRVAERWAADLADFVGLVTSDNVAPGAFAEALETTRARRAAEGGGTAIPVDLRERGGSDATPGSVGERRGSTRIVWLDAIDDMKLHTFSDVENLFGNGGFQTHQGEAYAGQGYAVNSASAELSIDGMATEDAKQAVIRWLESSGKGKRVVNYRLRDWLFSRQRYWGEPFPLVFDSEGNHHAVSESALPVRLPELADYQPIESEDPKPLLAKATSWSRTTAAEAGVAPTPGLPALAPDAPVTRELNTMPGWAGSCWYYLRYCDPENRERFIGAEAERYWLGERGVDLYVGGAEHAVLHLLYARFWHKVLFDLGEVSSREPFAKLFHQGLITSMAFQRSDKSLVAIDEVDERPGEINADGTGAYVERATGQVVTQVIAKMSKSLKNVINPDDVIADFGADTFRLYEMAMGPLEASKPWNTRDIAGCFRFLQRLWRNLVDENTGLARVVEGQADDTTRRLLHRTIKGVRQDIESLGFNTAISKLIEFNNHLSKLEAVPSEVARMLIPLLSPFVPHLAEELWIRVFGPGGPFVAHMSYPEHREDVLVEAQIELPVQVQGKVRGRIVVPAAATPADVEAAALSDERVREWLAGKAVAKVIVIPKRMVNVVVKDA
ncbi:MAG: class I tRNA ligase family protein [Planctomycetota bacterium]|nr:class I tRNA ligase family protein [Planctomycetota bacterium]